MTDRTADRMDEQILDEEAEATSEGDAGGKRRRKGLVIAVITVVLLSGAGAGLYATGVLDRFLGGSAEAGARATFADPGVYYELPEMLVNLNSSGRDSNFLKISVSLELDSEADVERLAAVQPRIVDNFQVYLRELRIGDLQGSAGLQRLREELLLRVKAAAGPVEVRDVLFKEMLVQ